MHIMSVLYVLVCVLLLLNPYISVAVCRLLLTLCIVHVLVCILLFTPCMLCGVCDSEFVVVYPTYGVYDSLYLVVAYVWCLC